MNKRLILGGVVWKGIETVINKGFAMIIKLVLARILFPADFGVIGMAAVFISFVQVFQDMGLSAALIQRKDAKLRESHFHTSFWAGLMWGLLIYLIVAFVVAPIAASFYDEPILRSIIPVLSLGIILSPINLVHKAQLVRGMEFKRLAFISNVSSISAGVLSLILALLGFGVWSLVFNSVTSTLIALPLFFLATRYVPKWEWDPVAFKDIFGFGVYTTGTSVFNNLTSKIDYLIIGKVVSASALGAYSFAFVLTEIARSQIMSVMSEVMYPVYGQKQGNLKAIRNYYLNVVKYNCLVIYPIMLVMLLFAGPIILTFFGDKWEASVPITQILSLSVMVHLLVNSNTVLLRGLGYVSLEFKLQMFKSLLIYIPSIFVGVYFLEEVGVALAVLFSKVMSVIIAQYYLWKIVRISNRNLWDASGTPIIASLVAGGVGYTAHFVLGLPTVPAGILVILTYGAIIWWRMQAEVLKMWNAATSLRRKKLAST